MFLISKFKNFYYYIFFAIAVVFLSFLSTVRTSVASETAPVAPIEKYFKFSEKYKERALNEDGFFYSQMREVVSSKLAHFLQVQELRRSFFYSSVTMIGCAKTDNPVIGFYDVTKHVWVLLWVNAENEIISNSHLSMGFEPKALPSGTAWFQLIENEKITIADALTKSIEIQSAAFYALFSDSMCTSSMQELEHIIDDDAAMSTLVLALAAVHNLGEETLKEIDTITSKKMPNSNEYNNYISAISVSKNHLFTIHNIRKMDVDQSIFLLTLWDKKNRELSVADQTIWPRKSSKVRKW